MLLAGDVGATNTRLGLFDVGPRRPVLRDVRVYPTAASAGIEDILDRFLADVAVQAHAITAAAFGVAGPVVGASASLTNVSWRVNAVALAAQLSVPHVRLVNDLVAMAYAVPVLELAELVTLQPGRPDPAGHKALMAPGTGLGEALLHNMGGRLVPSPSEAGHADLAPRTPREIDLLRFLTSLFGRASNEDVLCGPGLVNVHRFTHRDEPCAAGVDALAPDAPAQVTREALAGACAACTEVLDLFVSLLGAEAGNMALRSMATGGVYIGGGIPPKILPALQRPNFLDAFRAKGPMEDLLSAIPVHVIVHPDPALLGAAVAAGA